MTKKKPDFLRDLDTAIMDELTGGGIKGNAAGLVGTLTQIKKIKQLCGLPFCGYMAKLETVRPSGVPDKVTVVFAEDVPYRACNGIEFDVMQEFVEGSRLLLTGKVQTLKDFQSGRLLVYILADFVAVSEKAVEQDEAAVRGVIANKPTYRETPRGKRITDITVKVRNELTGGSCFLPCICWQEQADEILQRCWYKAYEGHNRVKVFPLDDSGNYAELASYLIKYTGTHKKGTDGALQGKRWNCSKNLVRPEPEYHIISDREYFKKEPKAIKGYYVDKNSVSMGVHSPEYYGYGYLRYTLVKITDRGG